MAGSPAGEGPAGGALERSADGAEQRTGDGQAGNEDVGIGGFDDWSWASLVGPGITTIAQPSYDVGAKSVERLLLRIQRGGKAKPKIFELPNKLILRGSSQL